MGEPMGELVTRPKRKPEPQRPGFFNVINAFQAATAVKIRPPAENLETSHNAANSIA